MWVFLMMIGMNIDYVRIVWLGVRIVRFINLVMLCRCVWLMWMFCVIRLILRLLVRVLMVLWNLNFWSCCLLFLVSVEWCIFMFLWLLVYLFNFWLSVFYSCCCSVGVWCILCLVMVFMRCFVWNKVWWFLLICWSNVSFGERGLWWKVGSLFVIVGMIRLFVLLVVVIEFGWWLLFFVVWELLGGFMLELL